MDDEELERHDKQPPKKRKKNHFRTVINSFKIYDKTLKNTIKINLGIQSTLCGVYRNQLKYIELYKLNNSV